MPATRDDMNNRFRQSAPFLFLALFLASCATSSKSPGPAASAPTAHAPQDKDRAFATTPVWADEFDYAGAPDTSKWGYDIGGSGWGNNELQYYTNNTHNASVADDKLTITARKEDKEGNVYTSARMVTKNKGDFLYGRFEVKAKLPTGKGTWPAIWMLPTGSEYGGWPESGEIDIMEHVGHDQNRVHVTVHTEAYNHSKGTQKGKNKIIPTASTDFHRYRVDWTPSAVRGYIDDQQTFEFVNEGKGYSSWPFDKRFHMLLNIAVGGNWGGAEGIDPTVFPQAMEVDCGYMR